MHFPLTHMFPAGLSLHPNEENEDRNLRRCGRAVDPDRALSDRLRSPYLQPERHLATERGRLPFRRDLP